MSATGLRVPNGRVLLATSLLVFSLAGCNWLRFFPLYAELYVQEHESIALDFVDSPGWWDYPTLAATRERVEVYVARHPDVPSDVVEALRRLTFRRGMNPDQILAVIGPPSRQEQFTDGGQLWTYDDRQVWGMRRWYYSWGRVWFEQGTVARIEAKYVTRSASETALCGPPRLPAPSNSAVHRTGAHVARSGR
jgi:hypothetical protein